MTLPTRAAIAAIIQAKDISTIISSPVSLNTAVLTLRDVNWISQEWAGVMSALSISLAQAGENFLVDTSIVTQSIVVVFLAHKLL